MTAAVDWLFRSPNTGRMAIAQWPNRALWLYLAARVPGRVIAPAGAAGAAVTAEI